MKTKKINERGTICAMSDWDTSWFYGWDLKKDEIQWPEDEIFGIRKTNVYGRWGFSASQGRLMRECIGPKQGAFKATRIDII